VRDIVAVLGTGSDDNVTSSSSSNSEHVDLDLRHGIVKGYSQYVTFVVSPAPTDDELCSARSVIRIDLTTGPFNRVRLTLDYIDQPRLWTVDVSDSSRADGYGVNAAAAAATAAAAADDDDNDDSNRTVGTMAETHVRILRTIPTSIKSTVFVWYCILNI